MAREKLVLLVALLSVCLAKPMLENEPNRRREVGGCDSGVISRMSEYGVDTSSLRCFAASEARGLHDAYAGRKMFRRSCCVAECAWMADELGVEPSSLICPT